MTVVTALSHGEHQKAAAIIADSFADDPVNSWIFRNPISMDHYYAAMIKKRYLPSGFCHIVGDAGATLWLPPNCSKSLPLYRSLGIAYRMVKYSGGGALQRGLLVDEALKSAMPKQPYYYLFAIGTRVRAQGQGIGGKLMEAGIQKVDAAAMPAYLESSKAENIGFYRRFGFEVVDKILPGKDCPPFWLMWRPRQ